MNYYLQDCVTSHNHCFSRMHESYHFMYFLVLCRTNPSFLVPITANMAAMLDIHSYGKHKYYLHLEKAQRACVEPIQYSVEPI